MAKGGFEEGDESEGDGEEKKTLLIVVAGEHGEVRDREGEVAEGKVQVGNNGGFGELKEVDFIKCLGWNFLLNCRAN